MKKYFNIAFIYALLAMASGVFYREFTKILGFSEKTTLSITHVHFFVLGFIMYLLIAVLTQITNVESVKSFKWFMVIYNVALPFMVVMFYVRGIMQVLNTQLSSGQNAAISGVAGIAHILITVAFVLLFISLKNSKSIIENK